MSASYLSDVENQRRQPPPAETVRLLAKALAKDPDEGLVRSSIERGAVEIPEDLTQEERARRVRAMVAIAEHG